MKTFSFLTHILKNIFILIAICLATSCNAETTSNSPDIVKEKLLDLTMKSINVVIASPAIQNLPFKVTKDCEYSILNDIRFCNAVQVSDSYEIASSTIDTACLSICEATKNTADGACDATRKTCNTGCDALKESLNGCYDACDAVRKTCKTGCFGDNKCENTCDNISKDCKNGCDKSFPYKSCNNSCDSVSSSCKSGSQDTYNKCASGCNYLKVKGGYELKLSSITGAGAVSVTKVHNMTVSLKDENLWTISLDLKIPSITANVVYDIYQQPIPAIKGNLPVHVPTINGSVIGTLQRFCSGNKEDKKPGYYLHLDNITIKVPSNIFDSSASLNYLKTLGIDTSYLESGINDLYNAFVLYANGELSKMLTNELNNVLETTKIMDSRCAKEGRRAQ